MMEVAMRMRLAIILSAVVLLAPLARAADSFAVDFTWDGTGKCFEPQSPPFTLSHVPAGTKTLHFNMVDLDFTAFHHGGGDIPYDGKDAIPRGGVAGDYRGRCPPNPHHYEWTIQALDAGAKVLAETKVMHEFPPQ
jgi:phosphatidylethanolamine-binding protein (PEBP) family uncharacterized protein